mmetsp:Transcript_59373/g.168862  ORF Transcript_59373/g.168862 Transcript_59373/m.168862 type:complete len:223 (-) Transcript_59373:2-670(-)
MIAMQTPCFSATQNDLFYETFAATVWIETLSWPPRCSTTQIASSCALRLCAASPSCGGRASSSWMRCYPPTRTCRGRPPPAWAACAAAVLGLLPWALAQPEAAVPQAPLADPQVVDQAWVPGVVPAPAASASGCGRRRGQTQRWAWPGHGLTQWQHPRQLRRSHAVDSASPSPTRLPCRRPAAPCRAWSPRGRGSSLAAGRQHRAAPATRGAGGTGRGRGPA